MNRAARRKGRSGRRPRLLTRVVCAATGLALAVSACTGGEGIAEPDAGQDGNRRGQDQGGELVIGVDADPIGLDRVLTDAFSPYDFIDLIYSGLPRWTPDMEIEPDIAVSYDNPNPRPTLHAA